MFFPFFCTQPGTCLRLQMWLQPFAGGTWGWQKGPRCHRPFPGRSPGLWLTEWAASHRLLLQDGTVPGRRRLSFGDLVASPSPGAPGSGGVLGLRRCRKRSSLLRLRMEGLFLRLEAGRCWGLRSAFRSPRAPVLPHLLTPCTGSSRDPEGSASRGWQRCPQRRGLLLASSLPP